MNRLLLVALLSAVLSNAQLTPEQRRQDMQQIANVLAKNYAPYEWKREAVKFDLYDLAPWLAKAEAANSDLSFYDVLGQYLGSLRDTHTYFDLPSDFAATLPLRVDIYDGKVLIESITRGLLPAAQYPFQVGDELVSLDGRTAQGWIEHLRPFAALGNKKANDRYAAGFIPVRVQAIYPRAHEIGEKAKVEIRRANGDLETYEIAWVKSGTPMEQVGPVPTPRT
ncbi:MAG: PDZ domain-containing protein, partial [Bryobacter sp.]|nr:PDZ domain-containing protein [Bryobacter sp.]